MSPILDWTARILLGVFGGAGFTALWEMWLKPRRQRKSLARALRIELAANCSYLLEVYAQVTSTGAVPFSLQLSTLLYKSVADQLGALPSRVVSEVVLVYRSFELLSGDVERYHYLGEEMRSATSGFERELFQQAESIRQRLPINIRLANESGVTTTLSLSRLAGEKRVKAPSFLNHASNS